MKLELCLGLCLAVAAAGSMAGCNPHVVIEQPKPLEININFTGHLDLVIHDARQDLEAITGEKPVNTVRPEDIGLPPAKAGAGVPVEGRALAELGEEKWVAVMLRSGTAGRGSGAEQRYTVAVEDDLKKAMAGRSAEIRALWDAGTVGESHEGLVVGRKALTAEQQKLVDAENKDRTALYAAEAASKKTAVKDVAIGYYLARLGYAKKGAWYEKANASGAWAWVQWGS